MQACASGSDGPKSARLDAITPTEQFPIEVRQNPDEVRLAIHDRGLSDGQYAALTALVDRWRETGGGAVTIQAPRGPGEGQGGGLCRRRDPRARRPRRAARPSQAGRLPGLRRQGRAADRRLRQL